MIARGDETSLAQTLELFNQAFDRLIKLNKISRKNGASIIDSGENITPSLARDFFTIHLDPGQRSGKSLWMLSKARASDVVILPSKSLTSMYKDSLCKNVFSIDAIPEITLEVVSEMQPVNYVFVEQSILYSREEHARIFRRFAHISTTFVFL